MPATAAARTLTYRAEDRQAGPRTVAVRITGPAGFALAAAGFEGSATPNRGCLAGQFISGCQTAVTRSVGIALPAVTGSYTATVTAMDGAGNVTVRSVELARVAAPTSLRRRP